MNDFIFPWRFFKYKKLYFLFNYVSKNHLKTLETKKSYTKEKLIRRASKITITNNQLTILLSGFLLLLFKKALEKSLEQPHCGLIVVSHLLLSNNYIIQEEKKRKSRIGFEQKWEELGFNFGFSSYWFEDK